MTGEFLGKCQNSFSAVQSEKTEINILQKEWGEKLFYFLRWRENYFWISLTPYTMLTPLIKIHCQLSHIMQNLPVLYFICAHNLLLITCFITSLIAVVLDKFSLCQNKMQRNTLPIFVVKEEKKAKIWWNPQVQRQTRSLGLSNHGLHCNQEEWLKELEDTSKPPMRLKDKLQ